MCLNNPYEFRNMEVQDMISAADGHLLVKESPRDELKSKCTRLLNMLLAWEKERETSFRKGKPRPL